MEDTEDEHTKNYILQYETWQHKFERTLFFLNVYSFFNLIIENTKSVCVCAHTFWVFFFFTT